MTVTIWWPRSGARIYQVVTGVTSDVGMPSTPLVINTTGLLWSTWVNSPLLFTISTQWLLTIMNKFTCFALIPVHTMVPTLSRFPLHLTRPHTLLTTSCGQHGQTANRFIPNISSTRGLKLCCNLNSRPRDKAFGAHNSNTSKKYPQRACKTRMMWNYWDIFRKWLKTWILIYLGGPKRPRNQASEANIQHNCKKRRCPNLHVNQDWLETSVKVFRKWRKTGILTYLGVQNDPQIRLLWSAFNIPLKVAPLNKKTKTGAKPVETFLKIWPKHEFWPTCIWGPRKSGLWGSYSIHL